MSEKEIKEMVVNPYTVEGEMNYERLLKEFGLEKIDEKILKKIKKHAKGELHFMLRRGIFFAGRDLNWVLDEYEKGNKFFLYTGCGPSGPIHIGHLMAWYFTKWLQDKFDVDLYFQFTDDEKFLYKDMSYEEIQKWTEENMLDVIAVGFNPKKTHFIVDTKHAGIMYPEAIKVAKKITFSMIKSSFGFTDSSNVGSIFYTSMQAVPAFLPCILKKKTGVNISTIHGILSDLVKKGYVIQQHERGKYSLGLKLLNFAGVIQYRMKVRNVAYPYMEKLSQKVGESVNLAIKDRNEDINIAVVHSNQKLQVNTDESVRLPLYSTGTGKIFLAHMSEEELEAYFKNVNRVSHTPNTITDSNKLKKQLQIIRQKGIAIDNEETELGVVNIASAIKNWDGTVLAAIGVLGPSIRLKADRVRKIAPTIKSYALEISRRLGYKGK